MELIRLTNQSKRELHIKAIGFGKAITCSKQTLNLYPVENQPADGIYEFEFVGSAPANFGSDKMERLFVSFVWPDYPRDLRGIRIHAGNNSILKLL